ncbi:MAG: immunoglobulin domain-containing protein [Verrucomicrobia bacterium]|nr:immunoglobulin domain-containing protein [Verrucomicrobiota bacterium]
MLVPPSITSLPLSQTNLMGSTVVFVVEATGTEPLRYQWRRNGANLAGATNATLTLPIVQVNLILAARA